MYPMLSDIERYRKDVGHCIIITATLRSLITCVK